MNATKERKKITIFAMGPMNFVASRRTHCGHVNKPTTFTQDNYIVFVAADDWQKGSCEVNQHFKRLNINLNFFCFWSRETWYAYIQGPDQILGPWANKRVKEYNEIGSKASGNALYVTTDEYIWTLPIWRM